MKISIVTISYNQEPFLEEAINSVLNQKDANVEYIVVDPGSTDNSRAIIEKYRDKIDHIVFEKDNGPGDGLNKGFKLATGEIFGYLNSDDLFMPGTLKKVNDFFSKRNNIDVVSAHGYVIDENNSIKHKVFSNSLKSNKYSLRQFACGNYVLVQPSTFFKKEIFNKVKGFEDQGKVVWDAGLIIDFILAKARFRIIDDYWSCFRVYPSSITGSGFFNSKAFNDLREYAKLSKISDLESYFLKFAKWMREPKILIRRVIDGIRRPQRLV
jgi:glycosyltransferase involved in cell wall biosynthesis